MLLWNLDVVHADLIKILTSTRAGDIVLGDGDDDLNSFYLNEGFTSSLFSGSVTNSELSGAELFIAMMPDDAFAASEITAMSNFLSSGGHILFIGEQDGFAPTENGFLNNALSGLGSAMSIGTSSQDPGFNNTVSAQIQSHPFTSNVNLVNYGNVNSISGVQAGNELFLAKDLNTIWGGVESLNGGTLTLLADSNMISNIEDTTGNDNHIFFTNLLNAQSGGANVPEPSGLGLLLTLAASLGAGQSFRKWKSRSERTGEHGES